MHRSALPPRILLNEETNADEFYGLMNQRNAFKSHPDIEALAAAIHQRFLNEAEKSQLAATAKNQPNPAWTIHPEIKRIYDELDSDKKAANRAAARRTGQVGRPGQTVAIDPAPA